MIQRFGRRALWICGCIGLTVFDALFAWASKLVAVPLVFNI